MMVGGRRRQTDLVLSGVGEQKTTNEAVPTFGSIVDLDLHIRVQSH
jgi:hypothetical protein